jgi:hypothetical protein
MIYLVERTDEVDYEEDRAAVVRARSVREAREVINRMYQGTTRSGLPAFRADGSNYTIKPVPSVGLSEVILTDNVGS